LGTGAAPALTGALGGLAAGRTSLLSRLTPGLGAAAGIGTGAAIGSTLHEKAPIPGPFGDIGRSIESFFNEKLGLGGGQKNTVVNVNTNEIGVTADDVISNLDVFG
jgi:hypothetical protein